MNNSLLLNMTKSTFLEQIADLESKGVFIDFSNETYKDGTNCNWQIEFTKEDHITMAYNDNHEFGDVAESMQKAVDYAYFLLNNPDILEMHKFSGWVGHFPDSERLSKMDHEFLFEKE